jgi:hypothetical protein
MDDKLVFRNPERWTLNPADGTLLWARYPTASGPVDIWLPPRTTVAELTELVIPHLMKCVKLQVEWNESVEDFQKRMAKDEPAQSEEAK